MNPTNSPKSSPPPEIVTRDLRSLLDLAENRRDRLLDISCSIVTIQIAEGILGVFLVLVLASFVFQCPNPMKISSLLYVMIFGVFGGTFRLLERELGRHARIYSHTIKECLQALKSGASEIGKNESMTVLFKAEFELRVRALQPDANSP